MKLFNFLENIFERKYLILFVFAISIFFQSFVVPPFQSPDEYAHFVKANSTLHLEAPHNWVRIYKNLNDYMNEYEKFKFRYDYKLTNEIKNRVNNLRWEKGQEKVGYPNPAAAYFPLVYTPAAIGIGVSRLANTTIHKTYNITRIVTTLFCLGILLYAFSLVKPNLLTILVLFTPMTIFQYVSTTPDCVSFSLIILIFSLFIKMKDSDEINKKDLLILSISILTFVGHRTNFLPIVFLPFILCLSKRNIKCAFASLFVILGPIMLWGLLCKTYLDVSGTRSGVPSSEIINYYLTNPTEILLILYKTFTNEGLLHFYWNSLIGNLGWLDYSITYTQRVVLSIMLIISFVMFFKFRNYKKIDFIVLIMIIMSFFMIYGALLIQWTPFPNPEYIDGVQGRYFIPIILSLGYLLNISHSRYKVINVLASVIVIVYIVCSNYSMMVASIDRYFIG